MKRSMAAIAIACWAVACTFSSAGGLDAGEIGDADGAGTTADTDPPGDDDAVDTANTGHGDGTAGATSAGLEDDGATGDTADSADGQSSGGDGTTDASTGASGKEDTGATATAGEESTGEVAASCDELYGAAPGYILCEENSEECHFNANTNGNCADMCMLFDGQCLAAFDNPNNAGQECDVIEPNTDTCLTDRGTELCVCSKQP